MDVDERKFGYVGMYMCVWFRRTGRFADWNATTGP
jgi:uncharacterized protein YodC (DUF2158 family)